MEEKPWVDKPISPIASAWVYQRHPICCHSNFSAIAEQFIETDSNKEFIAFGGLVDTMAEIFCRRISGEVGVGSVLLTDRE